MGRLRTFTNITFTTSGLPKLAPLTPSGVLGANLVGWWSADQLVSSSGNRVSAWGDQSSVGSSLVQSVSADQMLLVANAQNGLPGIENDTPGSSGRWIESAATITQMQFEYTQPFSVALTFICAASRQSYELALGQAVTSSPEGWWLDSGTTESGGKMGLWLVHSLGVNALGATSPDSLTSGQAYSYIFTYDGSGGAGGIIVYRNGASQTPTVVANNLDADTLVATGQKAFLSGYQAGNSCGHTILEAFVANRVITATEASGLDSYLNAKWAFHS